MSVAIITGSAGLIGSESVRWFASRGFDVVGVDNDMRKVFFGDEASTAWNRAVIEREYRNYFHFDVDIRDKEEIRRIFQKYGKQVTVIIHTAAQPSHDWAAKDPETDFTVNANGTLNLLEATRQYCPDAVFIFTSTNKVYGDTPNRLPLEEQETRWEVSEEHPYATHGIDENMSLDHTLHSLFGASKVAADILVQEHGRYFGMKTACFRGGCLTGPAHSGTQLHGFLAYLMKCALTGDHYTVFGYKGKQVRDNIHSYDLVNCFWHFFCEPRTGGEVYNIGGGPYSNCSMLEAIKMSEEIVGRALNWSYSATNRIGDHMWWVSDVRRFMNHYPGWTLTYNIPAILREIYESLSERTEVKSCQLK